MTAPIPREIKRRKRQHNPASYRNPVSTRLSDAQLAEFEKLVGRYSESRCVALRRIFDAGVDVLSREV